ncbi:MAG: TetR/AcrR family transcriptional regulator [Ktedonobacteraceae bacterium]
MPRKASRTSLDSASVVQAAAALIDTIGLEEITLGELAAHLKVRTPSLYNHIAGLPGLRRELALFGTREIVKRMGLVVMGKAGDDAIIALADAYRAFIKEHPGLYAATLRAAGPDDEELQAVSQELIDIVLRVLASYGLHDEDALHAVRAIRSIIHGFATLENARGFEIPIECDETFRRLITMFVASIKH